MTEETVGKRINVSFNRSLFREDLKGHEVWYGAKSFSYDPPYTKRTHSNPQHRIRIATGRPEFQSLDLGGDSRGGTFNSHEWAAFYSFEHSHFKVYYPHPLQSTEVPHPLYNNYLLQVGYANTPNAPLLAALQNQFLQRYNSPNKCFAFGVSAASAARERDRVTLFLEFPDSHKLTGPAFDKMDGKIKASNDGEVVYEFPSGQKVVAISKTSNRRRISKNLRFVRRNQLWSVWPSSDVEYESVVQKVLLAKGE